MRNLSTAFLALAAGAAFVVCVRGGEAQDLTARPVGAVLAEAGDVFVSRAGLRTKIGRGKRVFMGERLRSRSADGRLALRMIDGALLLLGGETDFQLNRYIYEPEFAAGEAALQMFAGVARYRAGVLAALGDVLIATPYGDVTATGDDFWMRVNDGRLELGVFASGVLEVKTAAGAARVEGPYQFTVVWNFGEPPQAPLPMSRQAIAALRDSLAFADPGVGLADALSADPDRDPPLGPETPGPDAFETVVAIEPAAAAFWRPPPSPEEEAAADAVDDGGETDPLDDPPLDSAALDDAPLFEDPSSFDDAPPFDGPPPVFDEPAARDAPVDPPPVDGPPAPALEDRPDPPPAAVDDRTIAPPSPLSAPLSPEQDDPAPSAEPVSTDRLESFFKGL